MAGMYSAPAPAGKRYNGQGQLEDIPASQSGLDPVTGAPSQYPTNGVNPSQQYDAATRLKLQEKQAGYASAAQDKTASMLPGVLSSVQGSGGQANVGYPGGVSPQQGQAAVEAQFARAKDKAGQIAKSALTGLSDYSAGQGMLGSGMQGEEAAKIVAGQAGGLSDLNREQAIQGLNYTQHANDMQYQGDIQQRGQNITLAQAIFGLLRNGGVAY